MNRDDILRMAREQGFPETANSGVFIVNTDDLGRILAAEREACAKVCDQFDAENPFIGQGQECAKIIRARAEK